MGDDRSNAGRIQDAMSTRGLAGKRDYVRSLEQRRDEPALALLVECLCDESWYLREMAVVALLKQGARCGPALLPLLEQGLWFSRSSAARVLGRMGFAPAAAPLLKLTSDNVDTVVRDACVALADLGRRGGLARVAWELNQLPSERRQERLVMFAAVDRPFAERLERLLRSEDLRQHTDPETLADDAPWVRQSEGGVEWNPTILPSPALPAGHTAGAPIR
jgi:HEAT repeat protein